MNREATVPVLNGQITKSDHVRIWCSWCGKEHLHGVESLQVGDVTHRSAHCGPDGPYSLGYSIRITSDERKAPNEPSKSRNLQPS